MAGYTLTTANSHLISSGDAISLYHMQPPLWTQKRWFQDGDEAIISFLYRLIGKKFLDYRASLMWVTSASSTTLEVR